MQRSDRESAIRRGGEGNEALMNSSPTNRQVCVVDDDAAIRDALKTILESGGYSIRMN